MSQNRKLARLTMAGLSVAAMTLIGAGPGIGLAGAQTTGGGPGTGFGPTPQSVLSEIPDTANLAIHKYTEPATKAAGNGAETTVDASAKPIQGVTFTARKVKNVDLTTNEGWVLANNLVKSWKDLSTAEKRTATKLSYNGVDYEISSEAADKHEDVTDADGNVQFNGIATGLYVVFESIVGDTVQVKGETEPTNATDVVQSEPFVVSVPLTDPTNRTEWLNTVHVYPKNGVVSIEKALVDENTPGSGNTTKGDSTIEYTIKTKIPEVDTLRNYQIIDPLDSRLSYTDTASIEVLQKDGGASSVTLEKGVDYEIVHHEVSPAPTGATNDAPKTGSYVTVTFTEAGRNKLLGEKGGDVKWVLNATIGDTQGKNEIPNKAYLVPDVPNNPSNAWDPENPGPNPPGTPSNEVVSKYGKVEILKHAKGDIKKGLEGAKFELYRCDATKNLGARVTVDNVDEWTSNDEGKIIIDGLQLNDFKNNSSKKDALKAWKDVDWYCLKETQAPANYEGLPEVVNFQLLSNDNGDQTFVKSVKIANVPSNSDFDLPLTGGNGIIPIIAVGGLLVAGAGAYAASSARRERKNNQ